MCLVCREEDAQGLKVHITLSSTLRNLLKQLFLENFTFFIHFKDYSEDLRLQTALTNQGIILGWGESSNILIKVPLMEFAHCPYY